MVSEGGYVYITCYVIFRLSCFIGCVILTRSYTQARNLSNFKK